MATVQLTDLTKRFGRVTALEPTSLTIDDGEFVVIVGPSGCGKSTMLRMIAGLDMPSGGRIHIGDRDVTDAAPSDRGLAMVFQSYALYPHLTVGQNIGFPLKVGGMAGAQLRERVTAVAETLELTALLSRRPAELSGGQRQRVSIARAIVREPKVLLLDEPLSNLDAELRVRMRHEFARLHARLGTTMIYVTHDQLEAMTLANRIVVMRSGRVEQVGPPLDLYSRPATLAVARAIGSPGMNFMTGVIAMVDGKGAQVRLADGGMLRANVTGAVPNMPVTIGVRPEHFVADDAGPFGGRVELFERLGPLSFAHLGNGDGAATIAQLPGDRNVTLGEGLRFRVEPGNVHLFDGDGRALSHLNP